MKLLAHTFFFFFSCAEKVAQDCGSRLTFSRTYAQGPLTLIVLLCSSEAPAFLHSIFLCVCLFDCRLTCRTASPIPVGIHVNLKEPEATRAGKMVLLLTFSSQK
ncbi:hypothetical protein BX666DRAFT_871299 [Dichotomocladium elegans]|nr:hypothetical protein BX666DRAFT_871299 [Dichotomocladium elegans]